MFSTLPMKHLRIQLLTGDLPETSLILAELGVFAPDPRPILEAELPSIPGEDYRHFYTQARSRFDKIARHVAYTDTLDNKEVHAVSEADLQLTNDWLGEVWSDCSEFEEERHRLRDQLHAIDELEQTLDNFSNLNIDLGRLQQKSRFLEIHIGMVARTQVKQLEEAVGLAGYLLYRFLEREARTHVIIIGALDGESAELKSVLDTAGFRPLQVPEALHSEPEKAKASLQEQQTDLLQRQQQLESRSAAWSTSIARHLSKAAQTLRQAAPYFQVQNAARNQGSLSAIQGWIPAREVANTEARLRQKLHNPFVLESRNPTADERPIVPSFISRNRLLKPFSLLVKQYGIPRYGEVNPTLLFAITYILMFGMMFGDVGHGAMILLIGILARRKLGSFTLFAVTAGISSMVFGLLYGSIFGYEHVIHAIWIAPMSDPLYMLSMALIWGVGFLILITLINIINHLQQNDPSGALFGDNGILSLLLYVGLLWGSFNVYQDGAFGVGAAIVSLSTLLALFAYKLMETEAPPGERILIAAIETFETVTGYASNTLSFLRVAAFSLNHVALAVAVFTLAGMMEVTGYWITVVLGNLFILILEGLIVTIQVLRLEYYEGFSRFFAGDGKAFKPLTL
ncbi:V-type ATP synthase subunit I [bacterium endosymbiont of Escarpia laminata]|nr:MAG: V-type ATP synthase subunit I [bacterium endosymbiont of Escarpia laminata]